MIWSLLTNKVLFIQKVEGSLASLNVC